MPNACQGFGENWKNYYIILCTNEEIKISRCGTISKREERREELSANNEYGQILEKICRALERKLDMILSYFACAHVFVFM